MKTILAAALFAAMLTTGAQAVTVGTTLSTNSNVSAGVNVKTPGAPNMNRKMAMRHHHQTKMMVCRHHMHRMHGKCVAKHKMHMMPKY